MTNTELYINGNLCDVSEGFNVRLNRQLLKPGELNSKDAQFSFNISLPATAGNNAIFNFAHIEETKGKFNRAYSAELIVNSVQVFKGAFRLSSTSDEGYKGNLYVPALKEIRDIFGDIKLNQNPELRLPFHLFADGINAYNMAAATSPQYAIFPYVLYGVIPKVPLNKNENNYSARTTWDASARLGMQDLAPSINPLLMLRHIFNAQGYNLQGDAFDNAVLRNLYMSYKNPDTYVQPWNYGQHASINISGAWSSRFNMRDGGIEGFEKGVNQNGTEIGPVYACDFLDSTNSLITVNTDSGGNVLLKEINDNDGVTWTNGQIRIPASGFYKVQLLANLRVFSEHAYRHTDTEGVQHIGGTTDNATNDLLHNIYEVRLCRDRKQAEFGLGSPKLNGTFFYNNQPQNSVYDGANSPKYFPQVNTDGQVNFVDLAQDRYHLLGFAFGWDGDTGSRESNYYRNPRDTTGRYAQILAAKPASSWMASENTEKPTRLAINSPGYMRYGTVSDFDDPGDHPTVNISYASGPFEYNKDLNNVGGLVTPGAGGNKILYRKAVERYYTYTIDAHDTNYEGDAFLYIGATLFGRVPFVAGVAVVNTTISEIIAPGTLTLTFYLIAPGFDVDGTLTITRGIQTVTDDVLGWTVSDKHAIQLDNQPYTFVRRGEYQGMGGFDPLWYADGQASAVVWLDAGELLTIASISSEGRYRQNGMHSTFGWVGHQVNFELSVEPFRKDAEWLKVNLAGKGTGVMDWNDPGNFDVDSINLVGFLNSDMKTDEFIENFCKAYNLKLTQINGATFSLDVRQSRTSASNTYIDLDAVMNLRDRENLPLGLPSLYKVGFNVDVDEEGYDETGDDGGGQYSTGVKDGGVVEQKSNFSFNWFKNITKIDSPSNVVLPLPIISKKDVWEPSMSYPEAMRKKYTDQPYRFWHYAGILPGTFSFNGAPLKIAKVSNTITGVSQLNYKDEKYTILRNFFTLLIDGASHYTEVEGYLSPIQYSQLNGGILVKFNADLYYVAEITGYDPAARNKTKLKLIRKIK